MIAPIDHCTSASFFLFLRVVQFPVVVQERTAQELSRKISGPAYQFRKKGNEMQFKFNQEVEESIASAKKELENMAPSDTGERATLSRATELLEEGASALKTWQKHIKVADRSRFGWGTVRHYPYQEVCGDLVQLHRFVHYKLHSFYCTDTLYSHIFSLKRRISDSQVP